jgi:hypothetical protein
MVGVTPPIIPHSPNDDRRLHICGDYITHICNIVSAITAVFTYDFETRNYLMA